MQLTALRLPRKRKLKNGEPEGYRELYSANPHIGPLTADGFIPVHLRDEFNTVLFCNNLHDARQSITRYTNALKRIGRPVLLKTNPTGQHEPPDVITWWNLDDNDGQLTADH